MWPSILMMSGCEASAASSCFFGARTFLASLVASAVCESERQVDEEIIAGEKRTRKKKHRVSGWNIK